MSLRGLLSWRPGPGFGGAVSRILAGSVTGQGLVMLSYPVLARLFDPTEFGLLVVFTSIVSMLGVLSTASLESAVLIPADEDEAAAVAWASLGSVLLTASATALVWWFAGPAIAAALGSPQLGGYWWLFGFTVLAIGTYLLLTEWMVRAQQYGALARRNLLQGVGQVVTQVGLGAAGVRPIGLLLGLGVSRLCGVGGALSQGGLLRRDRPRAAQVWAAVRRYRRFPLVASWSKLINTAGLQLPLLLISVLYGDARAGLLGLVVRVIGGPVGVIGQAVYQVFTAEASAKVRGADRELAAFTRRSVLRMLAVGAGPVALIIALGPFAFGLVFGPEWVQAGHFAQLLALAYLAEFAVTPISQTLFILERQGVQLFWDVTRLLLTAGGALACGVLGAPIDVAVAVLAVAHITSYTLLYLLSMRSARASDRGAVGH